MAARISHIEIESMAREINSLMSKVQQLKGEFTFFILDFHSNYGGWQINYTPSPKKRSRSIFYTRITTQQAYIYLKGLRELLYIQLSEK